MASIAKPRRPRLSKAHRRQRRRRRTRKDRAVRRQLTQLRAQLPRPALALVDALGRAFTQATALRFALLRPAALLTVGTHTVANLLRTLGPLVPGEPGNRIR